MIYLVCMILLAMIVAPLVILVRLNVVRIVIGRSEFLLRYR